MIPLVTISSTKPINNMVSSAFNCLAWALGAELSGSFIDRLPLCTILRHRMEIANPLKIECRTELQERALWRPPVILPPPPHHQQNTGAGRHGISPGLSDGENTRGSSLSKSIEGSLLR
jgi:hypothetical protein